MFHCSWDIVVLLCSRSWLNKNKIFFCQKCGFLTVQCCLKCVWGMSYVSVVMIPKVHDSCCLVAWAELEKKQLKTAGPWSRLDINKWEKISRAGAATQIVHANPICAVPSFFTLYRDSLSSLQSQIFMPSLAFCGKDTNKQRSSALKREWVFRPTAYFTRGSSRWFMPNGKQIVAVKIK